MRATLRILSHLASHGRTVIRQRSRCPTSYISNNYVGCSRWFSSDANTKPTDDAILDTARGNMKESIDFEEGDDNYDPNDFERIEELDMEYYAETEVDINANPSLSTESTKTTTHRRPRPPTSIKKINKLLSRRVTTPIPESDLDETFVRGSGPGGQVINKVSSSVSLIHLPTGIRIQAQPTRSREQNRKAARKILAERLDTLRATGEYDELVAKIAGVRFVNGIEMMQDSREGGEKVGKVVETKEDKKSRRKEEEMKLAAMWSKQELRWEKERRRKLNRSKKSKKKQRGVDGDQGGISSEEAS